MHWTDKVRAYIEQHGTTRAWVARQIGACKPAFHEVLQTENGWKLVQKAIRLARLLGTTVEDLFNSETDWPPTKP